MNEYHKIQSIYLRDPETRNRNFLEGQYTTDAFRYLADNQWLWSEKFDGTNVRVQYHPLTGVRFGGRTNEAQMPVFLMERLQSLFSPEKLAGVFPDVGDTGSGVMLHGEGYGLKIQKGGNYLPDRCDFILFDVQVGGIYLERHNVEDVANKLGIDVVPIVRRGTLNEAVEFVRHGFASTVGTAKAEGLVLRPECELIDRIGNRVITKIKTKDFL